MACLRESRREGFRIDQRHGANRLLPGRNACAQAFWSPGRIACFQGGLKRANSGLDHGTPPRNVRVGDLQFRLIGVIEEGEELVVLALGNGIVLVRMALRSQW